MRKDLNQRLKAHQVTTNDTIDTILGAIANMQASGETKKYCNYINRILVDYMPHKVIMVVHKKVRVFDGFYWEFCEKYGEKSVILEKTTHEEAEYDAVKCEMDNKVHIRFLAVDLWAYYIVEGHKIIVPIWEMEGKYKIASFEEREKMPFKKLSKKMCVSDDRIRKVAEIIESGKYQRREDMKPIRMWK